MQELYVPLYNIGEFLKQLRLDHGMSILTLSKKSGLSWATINRIERSKTMTTFKAVQTIVSTIRGPEEIILDDIICKTQ